MVCSQALWLWCRIADCLAGWLVLGAYIAILGLAGWLLAEEPIALFAIVISATWILLLITSRTTRGGWRWRWGKRD